MSIFKPHEVAALDALYTQKDEWFFYLYLLSDRVQEENELWADGIRFLCEIRQRPFNWRALGQSQLPKDFCWCNIKQPDRMDEFNNALPQVTDLWGWYGSLDNALTVFLHKWASLSSHDREKCWEEWGGVQC